MVLYLPDDPQWVLRGTEDDNFKTLVEQNTGIGWAIGYAVTGLICLFAALGGLYQFTFGPAKEPAQPKST